MLEEEILLLNSSVKGDLTTNTTPMRDSDVYMDLKMNIQQTNRYRQKSNLLQPPTPQSHQHQWYNQHDTPRSVCCTKMRALIKQLDSHACDDLIDSSSTLSPSLYSPLVIQLLFDFYELDIMKPLCTSDRRFCCVSYENHSCSLDPAQRHFKLQLSDTSE